MPRISTDNYDTVASWNGSQDLFIVEQPDGTKVATAAQIKQYVLGNSIDDIHSVMGQMGAKNLLVPKWTETQTTENGVTYTFNADGTVVMNTDESGATADTNCNLKKVQSSTDNIYPAGTYTISGCPSGGTGSTYRTWARAYRPGDSSSPLTGNLYDEGNGVTFTVNETFQLAINLTVRKNYVCNNLTWKPMLRLASDTDNTYQPYAMTNKQLTEDKADKTDIESVYSVMGQMGAKNLIPYPYNETTKTENGVTFTVNNDGTVIANGTAKSTAQLYLVLGNVSLSAAGNLVINTDKPLFLSGCPSGGGNTTYRIQYGLTDGTTYWAKTASDTGSGVKITPVAGLNSYCFDVIKIMVFGGYTVNNLTFKPMLRLASDTDDTYQPYAKTNKELTEEIGDLSQTGLTGNSVAEQLTTAKGQIATKVEGLVYPREDHTSLTARMDSITAQRKSGAYIMYCSSVNPDFSTIGYCMAIGFTIYGSVSVIVAVNTQTGEIWTNGNTSQKAGDWRGWRKIN